MSDVAQTELPKMSKGMEVLLKQVLKWMNLDPELITNQIGGIFVMLQRHVSQQDQMLAQQAEILERLKTIEGMKNV